MSKKQKAGTSAPPVDPRVSRLLNNLPLTQGLATGPVALPSVAAPSTEGLEVHVASHDLTEDELLVRFQELVRAKGTRRDRPAGERVCEGDEVQLDLLGYCDGKLIPFSARVGLWTTLEPMALLPGLGEAIAQNARVGDSLQLDLTLPADYPVAALRGKKARFIVDVRAAHEVKLPQEEGKALFKALGRGKDLDEVMDSIREELEEEAADELWLEAQDRVLDELVARAQVKVPQELVDEEIRRRWGQLEGKVLAEKGFDSDEQKEALDGWLADRVTRADCERRLAVGLVLRAIAEKDKLALTPEKLDEILEQSASAFGWSAEEAKAAGRADPAVQPLAWHLLAVGHVMEKAKIVFGDAPARP